MYTENFSPNKINHLDYTNHNLIRVGYTIYNPEEVEFPEGYIESLAGAEKCLRVKKRLKHKSTDILQKLLREIYNDDYTNKRRVVHLLIHEELTKRGIAPFWRKPQIIKFNKIIGYSEAEQRYMNDLQIADMYWVYINHPCHRSHNENAYGRFNNIFRSDKFNYEQANEIATWGWGPSKKAEMKGLKLDVTIQEELAVLRSSSTQIKMMRLVDKSHELEMLLNEAATRNPRRGGKTRKVIPDWVSSWMSYKLANGSWIRTIEIYSYMTGQEINKSTLRGRIDNTKKALSEVTNRVCDYF